MNDRSKILKIGLSRAIDQLQMANKDITFILDVPELNFDPRSCITSRFKSNCWIDKKLVIQRQLGYRKVIYDLARDNKKIHVIDPMNAFCDDNKCYAQFNGKILYRDHDHLGEPLNIFYGKSFLWSRSIRC